MDTNERKLPTIEEFEKAYAAADEKGIAYEAAYEWCVENIWHGDPRIDGGEVADDLAVAKLFLEAVDVTGKDPEREVERDHAIDAYWVAIDRGESILLAAAAGWLAAYGDAIMDLGGVSWREDTDDGRELAADWDGRVTYSVPMHESWRDDDDESWRAGGEESTATYPADAIEWPEPTPNPDVRCFFVNGRGGRMWLPDLPKETESAISSEPSEEGDYFSPHLDGSTFYVPVEADYIYRRHVECECDYCECATVAACDTATENGDHDECECGTEAPEMRNYSRVRLTFPDDVTHGIARDDEITVDVTHGIARDFEFTAGDVILDYNEIPYEWHKVLKID